MFMLMVVVDFVVAMMKLLLPVYTVRGFVMHGQWEDAPRHPLAIFTHYALHWLVALLFFLLYLFFLSSRRGR